MKINKKQAGMIIGLVCVVILILLLLTMCNGSGNSSAQTEPSTPAETVETSAATTVATEETSEPTEETTEATEETTEPTEETTGGNKKPGGTGGYNPGTSGGNNNNNNQGTTTEKTPTAGSKESPYMEIISDFPEQVSTVEIPANGTVYYNLNLTDETVATYGQSLLTIADANAYIIYDGKTYNAENGVVSVPLTAPKTAGAPVTIQVGSKQKASVVLALSAPLGTVESPEQIALGENGAIAIESSVESGDVYHYSFAAQDDGTLTLSLDALTENTDCDVIVTIGETQFNLAESADKTYTADVKKDAVVTVQVKNNAPESGEGIAAEVEISGTFHYYGSKVNPIPVTEAFTTKLIDKDAEVFYLVSGLNGKVLTISGEVIEGEGEAEDTIVPTVAYAKLYSADGETSVTYQPDAEGNVAVKIPNGTASWLVSIGNSAEETQTFDVTFEYPSGHKENPADLLVKVTNEIAQVSEETGDNTAVIEAGDQEVYYYTWTNEVWDGWLDITMLDSEDWSYSITRTNVENESVNDTYGPFTSADPAAANFRLLLSYDDVITLWVYTDIAENETQDSVSLNATFTAHTLLNSYTATSGTDVEMNYQMKVDAGTTRYFQTINKEANMTITGQQSFTVVYEGTTHNAALTAGTENEYTVQITNIQGETKLPETFTITTDDDTQAEYLITIWYPLGSYMNPKDMGNVMSYANGGILLNADSEYNYRWTAPADGSLHFQITNPTAIWKFAVDSLGAGQFTGEKDYIGASLEGITYFVDIPVTAGEEIRIRVINPDTAIRRAIRFETTFSLVVDSEPADYSLTLEDNQELLPVDLTQYYNLEADENGYYHVGTKEGPLVLVDLSNVNVEELIEWLETSQVNCFVGESTESTAYSDILVKYLAATQELGESEEDKKLLYPLTKDLMNILRNFGAQQGWYDSENAKYLFSGMDGLDEDSLWMFPCYYVNTVEASTLSLDSDTETNTETEPETETEPQSETEPEAETEPEKETESETETEPETETQAETEPETKSEET